MYKSSARIIACWMTFLLMCGILPPTLLFPNAAQAAEQTAFYVSPIDGSDSNPGTLTQPFATIQKAREAVRNVNSSMTGDIAVYLRGGNYYLDSTISLDERDSGSNGYQVVYRNYPGEEPKIYGGKPVAGWQPYQGNIYKVHVGTDWKFYTLIEGEERSVMARYPNQGYQTVKTMDAGSPKTKFGFADGDIPNITNPKDLQVFVWPGGISGTWNWITNTLNVQTLDYINRSVTVNGVASYELGAGTRYYLQGALELLDSPGEFYLDKTAGDLYYWPRGQSLDRVIVPKVQRIFEVKGTAESSLAHDIRFEGLAIMGADAAEALPGDAKHAAVYVENAIRIEVRNNKIHDTGLMGVFLNNYAQDNVIYGNLVYNTGFTGIRMIGPQTLRYINKNNTVENNHIYNTGILQGDGAGITMNLSGDNRIVHNRIHDNPRFAISFGTGWYSAFLGKTIDGVLVTNNNLSDFLHARNNLVAYNELFDAMKDSQDGGVIYTAGTGPGNVIRNNRLHDNNIGIHFGMGIYLDTNSDQVKVADNIIDNNQWNGAGIFSTAIMVSGFNDIVENNIVADNNIASSGSAITPYNANQKLTVARNIVFNNDQNEGSLYSFNSWNDSVFASTDYNLFYNDSGKYTIKGWPIDSQYSVWRSTRYDRHSITENPQFMSPQTGDYRLRYDSPAYAQGIRDIDFAGIGLLPDFRFGDAAETLDRLFVKSGASATTANVTTGGQAQLEVSGRTVNGAAADLSAASVTYTSDHPEIAAVNSQGTITGVSPGVAQITIAASKNGTTTTTGFDVIVDDSFQEVTLHADKTALLANETLPLRLMARSLFGQYYDVSELDISYGSSDEAIASVDGQGVVTAHNVGNVQINATMTKDGVTKQGSISIDVRDTVMDTISVRLADRNEAIGFMDKGESLPLTVRGTLSNGQPVDLSASSVIYESGNPDVATVSPSGIVTGVAEGKANIVVKVTYEGIAVEAIFPVAVLINDQAEAPWQIMRYGTAQGYVTGSETEFTMLSSGKDVWGKTDDFTYVYQEAALPDASYGFSMTATVHAVERTNASAAAGIMIRDSAAPDSKNVMLRVTPSGGLLNTYRENDGGDSKFKGGKTLPFPVDIKLTREGDVFTSYYKENGVWVKYHEINTVMMDNQMLAGTGVFSVTDNPTIAKVGQVTFAADKLPFTKLMVSANPPGQTSVAAGGSIQLSLAGIAGERTPIDLSGVPISFESSNPAVATVDSSGLVRGVSDGPVTVTATATVDGVTVSGRIALAVWTPKLAQVDLSGSVTGMRVGQSHKLAVIAKLENGEDAGAVSVAYASSNTGIAEVNAEGLVTAKANGLATITADVTLNGITKRKAIAVVVNNGAVFSDSFEQGLAKWQVHAGTPNVSASGPKRSGAYGFKLDQDVEALYAAMPQLTKGVVEAWFYDSGAAGIMGVVALQKDFMAGVISSSSATNYSVRIGNNYTLAGAREAGWHQVVYDLASATGKVNIYVDGEFVKQAALNGFTQFWIMDIWAGKTSNLIFDDITVYRTDGQPADRLENVTLATANSWLLLGGTTDVSLTGTMTGGQTADLNQAVTTFTSSNPEVASVASSQTASGAVYGKLTALQEGVTEVRAAVTLNGETVSSNAATVIVDQTPPVTDAQVDGIENGGWYTNGATLMLSAADIVSGVDRTEYSLDNGSSWNVYSSPITFDQDGSYTISYRSKDRAGNVETERTIAFRIDMTAPTASVAYSVTTPTNRPVVATITPSEPVTITNNGGSNSYTFLANGSFTFTFVDEAGNTGTATAIVNNIATSAGGVPGKPSLSDDNGHDTGIMDGDYKVTMNLWWGNNGTIYNLYENDVRIDTQMLTDSSPSAQSTVTSITYRMNGTYRYVAELVNAFGTTRSDVLTVRVTDAAPAKPVLSHDNWDGDGSFQVSMNMWWGTNGSMYRLYENGVLIDTQMLTDRTPQAQSAVTSIHGKQAGVYEYRCELVNNAGTVSSETMIVAVN
ncbi:Ig-like domain-containing protein [Paenibacillus contaminans]|nr:Ig-like domain-containing protein [Paenibacillus contaminans]